MISRVRDLGLLRVDALGFGLRATGIRRPRSRLGKLNFLGYDSPCILPKVNLWFP